MPKFTHKKKTYFARCLQWTNNDEQVMALLRDANIEASPYGGDLMLRYDVKNNGTKHTVIDMFRKGMWVRVGENGAVKLMRNEDFKLKYEPLEVLPCDTN